MRPPISGEDEDTASAGGADPGDAGAARRLTRAQFLRAAGGAAALAGGAYAAASLLGDGDLPAPPAVRRFRSRPDLRPPGVAIAGEAGRDTGYLLLGPGTKGKAHVISQPGVLIVDPTGEPLWFRPTGADTAANFRIESYGGEPVLAWWQGSVNTGGYGAGIGIVLDSSYRQLARVAAGNGRRPDLHELKLTPEGTALITCYPSTVDADLSDVGGPARGKALECVIQEVELRTGRVLLEWRSLEHVSVGESYRPYHEPYDYLHANSVDVTPDGHLLVSARHTWALYKLDRRTGAVIWRLGGKRSDYGLDPAARFAWQHDARQLSPSEITLFDNGSDGSIVTESQSRAIVLELDEARRRVRLQRAYHHPSRPLRAAAMGSLQVPSPGTVLVGWGLEPFASEFSADGALLADARLPRDVYSYRAARSPWEGRPGDAPAVAIAGSPRAAYVSWNGATEVSHWQLRAGSSPSALRPGPAVARRAFETAIALGRTSGFARVAALDRAGRTLGISDAVRI